MIMSNSHSLVSWMKGGGRDFHNIATPMSCDVTSPDLLVVQIFLAVTPQKTLYLIMRIRIMKIKHKARCTCLV